VRHRGKKCLPVLKNARFDKNNALDAIVGPSCQVHDHDLEGGLDGYPITKKNQFDFGKNCKIHCFMVAWQND
jgi:hypothetical protein